MSFSAAVVAGCSVGCSAMTLVLAVLYFRWLASRRAGKRAEAEHDFPYVDPNYATLVCRQLSGHLHEVSGDSGMPLSVVLEAALVGLHCAIRHFVARYLDHRDAVPVDRSAFDALAGPHDDWELLHTEQSQARESALVHFISRVLFLRMIPHGDVSTTLLPADMLSTYQRIMIRPDDQLDALHSGPRLTEGPGSSPFRMAKVARHYWRSLTVKYSYDVAPYYLDKFQDIKEDDPRMASIIATEDALKDILAPFYYAGQDMEANEGYHGGFESKFAREEMRDITKRAANLALVAFKQPNPVEFFWPPSGQPEGQSMTAERLQLECFGVRYMKRVPGVADDNMDDEWYHQELIVVREPVDSQTYQREVRAEAEYERLITGRYPWETK